MTTGSLYASNEGDEPEGGGPQRVVLRDGREEPLSAEEIRGGVLRAQEQCGEDDPQFATEVAEVVDLTLRKRPHRGPIDVDDVEDLVERALVELGRTAVAKSYILERARRERAREALVAAGTPREGRTSVPENDEDRERRARSVRVSEAGGTTPWTKGRIANALVNEADLPRQLADDVATRVEERVFSSGVRRLTTALIRELVDNELVDMGLANALRRQGPVGIPRHDLRRLFEGGDLGENGAATGALSSPSSVGSSGTDRVGPTSLAGAVASEVLRRYAIDDVLDSRSADLHSEGELSLENITRPHLHLSQCVPAEVLLRGTPGPQSAFDLLDELARVGQSVCHSVVLEAPAPALAPLIRGVRADASSGLGAWLSAIRSLQRATGVHYDLARPGRRSGSLIARLISELARLATDGTPGAAPRLFLEHDEWEAAFAHAPDCADSAERLLARGLLVPVWHSSSDHAEAVRAEDRGEKRPDKSDRFAGPGCTRSYGEHGGLSCGGAVALHLPRLARRAGPWREDVLFEAVVERVEDALDLLARLRDFQERHRGSRTGEVRGRVSYAITPVGLGEALRILGDGDVRAEQGSRLLGLLADAASKLSKARGLSVQLTPFFGERAAVRFRALDRRQPRAQQGLLFDSGDDADDAQSSRRTAYSHGYDLRSGPAIDAGAAEGVLLSTVPIGALVPFPASMNRGAQRDLDRLVGRSALTGGTRSDRPSTGLQAWAQFQNARQERRTYLSPSQSGQPNARGPAAAGDAFESAGLFPPS